MSLIPVTPRTPLSWPALVEHIASTHTRPAELYLVGGPVRDALLGQPIHDIDLVTSGDGLTVARRLADSLGGAYYPVDPERHTGRVILEHAEGTIAIDVASYRGSDLLEDLTGRDFTINAMAVRLDLLDLVIDPLSGQRDLFDLKLLRQCAADSIWRDPIRALRAVRHSLQLQLRMEPDTREAVRAAASQLVDGAGDPIQPERLRDELFKILGGRRPSAAQRQLAALGLLDATWPSAPPPAATLERCFSVVEHLHQLLTIISPRRSDVSAADVLLGWGCHDRIHRQQTRHVSQVLANERRACFCCWVD
jgi:tRNA nucleotidyltransferase/poly(A) polymerase